MVAQERLEVGVVIGLDAPCRQAGAFKTCGRVGGARLSQLGGELFLGRPEPNKL